MLKNHDRLLEVVYKFRNKEIDFHEYSGWLRTTAFGIGYELNYEGDWGNKLDAWLELIEYCYPEEDWYELGCSLGKFIEDAIINEPRPLKLPENDRVVRQQFLKIKKPGS